MRHISSDTPVNFLCTKANEITSEILNINSDSVHMKWLSNVESLLELSSLNVSSKYHTGQMFFMEWYFLS